MKFQLKPYHIVTFSILLLAIDQITKILVKTSMTAGEFFSVAGKWFYIYFIENPGAAYGMQLGGEYGKLALSLFRLVAIGLLIYYICRLYKRKAPVGLIFAFSMIMIGALGNVVDSAFYGLIFSESTPTQVAQFVPWGEGYATFLHGNVVDMLHFPIIDIAKMPSWVPFFGGERFVFFSPIFNMADTYISIAVIYIIIFHRKFFYK